MSEEDLKVIQAMMRFGGSFVAHLGKAALYADHDNLQRIKDAFPHYWKQYTDMTEGKS